MVVGPPEWDAVAARLERAARCLLAPTPGAVEEAATELESVESRLRELLRAPEQVGSWQAVVDARSLRELQRSLRIVALLLENAGALRVGWARLISVMAAGYTSQGQPAPLQPPPSVVMEG